MTPASTNPRTRHLSMLKLTGGWQDSPMSLTSVLARCWTAGRNKGYPRPYLANVNVRWGRFDLDDLREMRFEEHEIEKYGLRQARRHCDVRRR